MTLAKNFDANRDGKLSKKEFGMLFRRVLEIMIGEPYRTKLEKEASKMLPTDNLE
jgi:hypothetical protein